MPCVLCVLAFQAACFAQNPAAFKNHTTTSGYTPANIYAVDLNNDGIPDIVQDTTQTPNGFTVSIANGDGTFKAPVFYSVNGSTNSGVIPSPIVSGDFNNDGKVDLVVQLTGTNQVAVFLGKGDGTFESPKYVTLTLPSGQVFAASPIIAADYNQDGKLDLVAVSGYQYTNRSVIVFEGDGVGGFSNPHTVFTSGENTTIFSLVTGDFDGDGKPDIALAQTTGGCLNQFCGTTLHVLYGDNEFGFDDVTMYSVSTGLFTIASGDVNDDGKTEIFGLNHILTGGPGTSPSEQLGVFYGNLDRTFNNVFVTLPNPGFGEDYNYPGELTPELTMADFNGDGIMDLVASDLTYSSNNTPEAKLVVFITGQAAGEFTQQSVALPSYQFNSNPVVANENGDVKPDIVISQSNNLTNSNTSPSYLTTAINESVGNGDNTGNNFSPCTYPSIGQSMNLCSQSASTSTNQVFNVSANSFGQLRKIELWIDGNKLDEEYNTWGHNAYMNYSSNFTAGNHAGTIYAVNIDNTKLSLELGFKVDTNGACTYPPDYGVAPNYGLNVCTPVAGSTIASPVQVSAAAYVSGKLDRMEIWVDGVKKYTETTSLSFNTSLTISSGDHELEIYAVNTAGTKYEKVVDITVK
jgi:hypothetical protein